MTIFIDWTIAIALGIFLLVTSVWPSYRPPITNSKNQIGATYKKGAIKYRKSEPVEISKFRIILLSHKERVTTKRSPKKRIVFSLYWTRVAISMWGL